MMQDNRPHLPGPYYCCYWCGPDAPDHTIRGGEFMALPNHSWRWRISLELAANTTCPQHGYTPPRFRTDSRWRRPRRWGYE